jgi:hypothetical protein
VRGGLDEALSRLARRDELRRRAAGQTTGTPQAVTELVEAVAAVVARHPELAITMGVEGAGDPVLLQFALEDGVVQVTADNTVAGRIPEASPTSPRHADFDLDLDVVDETHTGAAAHGPVATAADPDGAYGEKSSWYGGEGTHDTSGGTATDSVNEAERGREPHRVPDGDPPYGEDGRDLRRTAEQETYELAGYHLESPTRRLYAPEPVPSPLAATPPPPVPSPLAATPPPPVPPQSSHRSPRAEPTRPAAERRPELKPLAKPEPLRFEPEATELAAKRLAAMLREDPSLLQQAPPE